MVKSSELTSPSVDNTITLPIPPLSKQYHTGLLNSCPLSNLQPPNPILVPSSPSISKPASQPSHLKIHASTSSFEGGNGSMVKVPRQHDIPSLLTSFSTCSMKSRMMKKVSMSKWLSAWVLPPSYDLENLHGILGPQTPIASFSPVIMLSPTPLQ